MKVVCVCASFIDLTSLYQRFAQTKGYSMSGNIFINCHMDTQTYVDVGACVCAYADVNLSSTKRLIQT